MEESLKNNDKKLKNRNKKRTKEIIPVQIKKWPIIRRVKIKKIYTLARIVLINKKRIEKWNGKKQINNKKRN